MTDAAACERCPREVVRAVASRGPVPARLLFLSGAPRSHEEHEGVAFASPLFSWLEETLATAGLDPAGIHYATLTGCRPPRQRPVRGEEITACATRLEVAIAAVAPAVIVVCGPEPLAAVLPGVTVSSGHGQLVRRGRRWYYPIRHPYTTAHSERYVDEMVDDLRRLALLLSAGLPANDGDDERAPEHMLSASPAPIPVAVTAADEDGELATIAGEATDDGVSLADSEQAAAVATALMETMPVDPTSIEATPVDPTSIEAANGEAAADEATEPMQLSLF